MPTPRKRIGFLPRSEVQNLIDRICNHNKLSQSKVTGLLVEEALKSRGVLNTTNKELSFDFFAKNTEESGSPNKTIDSEIPTYKDSYNLDDLSMYDEIQMINEFIEFKFFKNIMIKNKRQIL